jgi:putative NIF3 family GTP cyclohydrolase 1 type 2
LVAGGSGVTGILPEPLPEQEFLDLLKDVFNLPMVRHTKLQNREIRDVALCGGAGAFLIPVPLPMAPMHL